MTNLNLIVLRALLKKAGWESFGDIVSADLFPGTDYRRLYNYIKMLHEQTESDVTVDAVRGSVEVQLAKSPQAKDTLLSHLDLVDETEDVPPDQLRFLVRKFIERSKVYAAAEYAITHVEDENFDVAAFQDLVEGAVGVSGRVDAAVTDLFETSLSGAPDNRPVRHSLGVSRELDARLRGGTGPGELFLYLAPPSVGKTTFLVQSGAAHARKRGCVLHITLEINTRKVIERYDQAWTGLTREELQTPQGQDRAAEARAIVQAHGGEVYIVDWSYQPATAQDVVALVRRMRGEGKDVTMICLDYLELMTPSKLTGREYRASYNAIGKEIRSAACALDIPIMSAWQVNREGSKKTFSLLSKEDVSESWDIIKHADTIVGLNQNAEQLRRRLMVLNIIKQRESTDRSEVEIFCDLDRLVIRDLQTKDHFANVRNILSETEGEDDERVLTVRQDRAPEQEAG